METGAQREAARIRAENVTAGADSKACLQAAFDKPEYANIEKKSSFNAERLNFTLQMLSDPSLPTKDEIKSLYAVYSDMQECRQLILSGSAKAHQLYMLAFVESFSNSDRLWTEFTKGKMPWGKFNEGRKSISEDTQHKLVQTNMQVGGQLENQHQNEIEQRQRAAAVFQQWAVQQQALAVQQQAIAAANRPRIINCNYFGNTAQCNSN
jgi:hypothetical protein